MTSFGKARDTYVHQSGVRSQHTLDAYLRAIDLFLIYLDDRQFPSRLPIQNHLAATAEDTALNQLSSEDEAILKYFALWLQTAGSNKRSYALSTVELRLAGVCRWFEYMQSKGWLPAEFSLNNASGLLKQHLASLHSGEPMDKSVDFNHDLSDLVIYYANQTAPQRIQKSAEQLRRWELTRLRNHALLQTLAETGGQVSAILSLNVSDMDSQAQPLIIGVSGKSEHIYQITLDSSLPAVRSYLKARETPKPTAPLFVSHDAHYDGKRMSRVIAWRIVQRAARAIGLPEVSPHDLRHWRAQQLITAGVSPEELRQKLGHRSSHTILAYYGHLFMQRDSQKLDSGL